MNRPWPPLSAYARFWLRQRLRGFFRFRSLTQAPVSEAPRIGRHPSLGGVWPLGIGAPTEMPEEFAKKQGEVT